MSFILDALKKSEDERQGVTGPNLAYAPTGGRREGIPRWVLVLSVLLLVNLAGLVAVMLWKQPVEVTTSRPATGQVTRAAPGQVTPPVVQDAPDYAATKTVAREPVSAPAPDKSSEPALTAKVRSLAEEAQADTVDKADSYLSQPQGNEPAVPTASQAPAAGQEQEKASGRVPSLNELLGEGKMMNLQSLSLDLHVYAARKQDRFVFINLAKYQEGQILKEGPRVEEITNDGVILQYQGERFLLPRS